MKLSDLYLFSDIDGTLLPAYREIPERNLQALHRFTQKGGRFALATGRSKNWVKDLRKSLPINAPCVLFNGGLLYDFEEDRPLAELLLPPEAADYMRRIIERFAANLSVLIVAEDDYYNVYDRTEIRHFVKSRSDTLRPPSDWRDVPAPWNKILFLVSEEDAGAFFTYVNAQAFPGVRFVATNATLIEMLPQHSSKGSALEALMEKRGLAREQLAAIGDYYNDREMLLTAGISATLCDSPEDLRARADFIAGPCSLGAVADFIEYLEERFV